jgi:hypothetical protein
VKGANLDMNPFVIEDKKAHTKFLVVAATGGNLLAIELKKGISGRYKDNSELHLVTLQSAQENFTFSHFYK